MMKEKNTYMKQSNWWFMQSFNHVIKLFNSFSLVGVLSE